MNITQTAFVAVVLVLSTYNVAIYINDRVKIPAPNIPTTVTRLEKDIALNPDRPCPDVHPPANLAPNAMTTPPTKAYTAGMKASTGEDPDAVLRCMRAVLPAMVPNEKLIDLCGKNRFVKSPSKACMIFRLSCSYNIDAPRGPDVRSSETA